MTKKKLDVNEVTNLRRIARDLGKQLGRDYLRLGTVLGAIKRAKLYARWGYSSFADYVETEVGICYTTAWRVVRLDAFTVRERLSKAERDKLAELGVSKASIVAGVAKKATLGIWLVRARKQTISGLQAEASGRRPDDAPKAVGIWLHGHQRKTLARALDIAIDESDTGYQGEALAIICEEFINARKPRRKRAGGKG